MNSKPITPDEVTKIKKTIFPDEVFDAFNELIAKNFNGRSATVKQKDVVTLIVEKSHDAFSRQQVFDNHWLDVEDVYREFGWKVEFDKPGYNETYDAFFKFTKR